MTRKKWHQLHKWIAIVVGVFLLMWTISGIVMVIPPRYYSSIPVAQPVSPDYRRAMVSPAQAITTLEQSLNRQVNVWYVRISPLEGDPVYVIDIDDGSSHLFDATSGEAIGITTELAEQIARSGARTQAKAEQVQYLSSHDALYQYGTLPVYRVVFEGDSARLFYVSAIDGGLTQSTQMTRIVAKITGLHTFEPVKLFSERESVRKGLLILAGLVGIAAIVTGYYLAVLPMLKRKSKSVS